MITSISTISRNPAVVGDGLLLPSAIALAAPYAPSGRVPFGTSSSTVTIGLGARAFVTQRELGFQYGMRVRAVVEDVGNWIEGVVTSYSDDDLTIMCDLLFGAGTYDDWVINLTGQPGQTGPIGPQGPEGEPGIVEEAPSDGDIYGRKNANWVPAGIGALTAADVGSVPAGNIAASNVQAALDELDLDKLAKAGGTMTGHLFLPTAPAAANAVRKDYVDAGDAALATGVGDRVLKLGDTMTGPLILPGAPTLDLHAATKLYVDTSASAGGSVRFDSVQTLTEPQKLQARQNIYASPFDAMGTLGMQLNGDHWISQLYGTGSVSLPVNSAFHVIDNWRFATGGAPLGSAAQDTNVPNGCFPKSVIYIAGNTVASPAAGDLVLIQQRLDFARTAHLGWGTAAGQPMTMAFWIASSLTGNVPVAVRTGLGARSYVTTVALNASATQYAYRTVTIPPDASFALITDANQQAIDITWAPVMGSTYQTAAGAWTAGNYMTTPGCMNLHSLGSGHWIRISGVRFFRGSQAPTAEQSANCSRNYADQLRECQRYYSQRLEQQSGYYAAGGPQSSSGFLLPTRMRANPAVSFSGIGYANASALALSFATQDIYSVTFTCTALGSVNIQFTSYFDARM